MKCIRAMVYSNAWVAAAAPSMLWVTRLYTGLDFPSALYVFVFLGTLATYNVQRLYGADIYLSPGLLPRHAWIQKNRNLLWVITASSMGILIVPALEIRLTFFLWLLPSGIVSLVYFLPIIPNGGKRIRLRDIPFLKIGLVAFVWSWTTVAAPCMAYGNPIPGWLPLFGFQFFLCFGLTLPFDIRDREHDRQAGTKTWTTRFGITYTKLIALSCFLMALFSAVFAFPEPFIYAIVLLTGMASILVFYTNPNRSELYYGGLLDGVFVMQGFIFFLFRHLFS
ncbi:MAG: UbiA family prenyltransferase [Flavobacteriales bacterium]|nr:UbiA family prenyltransferase [Flavobacteriales bacterium]